MFRKKTEVEEDRIIELGERLLKLEINVVKKENMTASPLKTKRHALCDIGDDYISRLKEIISEERIEQGYCCFEIVTEKKDGRDILGKYYQKLADGENQGDDIVGQGEEPILYKAVKDRDKGLSRVFLSQKQGEEFGLERVGSEIRSGWPTGSYSSFHRIREIADKAIEDRLYASKRDLHMLTRIRDMSDHIKQIFIEVSRNKNTGEYNDCSRSELMNMSYDEFKLKLSERQLSMLWKIWDIRTEEVLMQTVIFADGDVTTRVDPSILGEENKFVLDLHREAVGLSFRYWKSLVEMVVNILSVLSGKKPE